MLRFSFKYYILIGLLLLNSPIIAQHLVKNVKEFNTAVKNAQPGDTIRLANGVWKDAELLFEGEGTEQKPIVLMAQEPGKVTLEGLSNLRLAGKYLVVSGLVFKNGYSPTSELISFKKDSKNLAYYCRVTECVVDNFTNPERSETDLWVAIYGKHNRFDHNHLEGKGNNGVTLAVRLNSEESQQNFHQIDHNYFGPRQVLGSNGGETLRIGTSHYSMSNSNTIVEYNYFDQCNGEHEIISNKSCQNIFRYNTFYESQGTLTMRHGNETLVESNYFFGNGAPNTGGIRVINEKQKVFNNYCEGLTGYRFRGALVIMNGVPNSPLNRYFQVKDSEVSNNTFVNCDYIQLCAGSDAERSAVPVNTVVQNNIFYNEKTDSLFTVYDDISGIRFGDNMLSINMKPISKTGFVNKKINFKRNKTGILMPESNIKAGMTQVQPPATLENTGVSWYPKRAKKSGFGTGKVIAVKPGLNTLYDALQGAMSGDVLELSASGEYLTDKFLYINTNITIRGAANLTKKPVVLFERTALFEINNGGALRLQNLHIDGKEAADMAGNSVIRTSRYSMSQNYRLFIDNCDFTNLNVNHSFNLLKVFKSTFADSILIRDCNFSKVTGHIISMAEETDDLGIYNVENVVVDNCTFKDIEGSVLNLYRGGSDESTFGPMLWVSESTFENVGHGSRNKTNAAIALHGVQFIDINNSSFKNSKGINLHLVVGDPVVKIRDCVFENTPKIQSNDPAYETKNLTFK